MNVSAVWLGLISPLFLAAPAGGGDDKKKDGGVTENLDSPSSSWHTADGWTNGNPFNNGWRSTHATFKNGIMTLTLDKRGCPSQCSGKPYASSEYRSNQHHQYGTYEVRMKAAKGDGVVTSFFTYTGPSESKPHDEIDIEFLGKNPTIMQVNYWTGGQPHETILPLGFDASQDFHSYAFRWEPDNITWLVDGKIVHTETGSRGPLPTHPGRIMMNLWPGIGVDGWLNPFKYTSPLTAQYDWVRFTPYSGTTTKPGGTKPLLPPPSEITSSIPPAEIDREAKELPGGALHISDVYVSHYGFNGGLIERKKDYVFHFSAAGTNNPGFRLSCGYADLQGKNTLSFEIKGNVPPGAKLLVKFYFAKDAPNSPSITSKATIVANPIEITGDYAPVTINLKGQTSRLNEIEFILVADNASPDIYIRKMHLK